MSYAYYPGCSLETTALEYDRSLRAVSTLLGIELQEIPGWYCCGSGAAHSASRLLGTALPLGNLALARKMGHDEVVVPCPSCLFQFRSAKRRSAADPRLEQQTREIVPDHSAVEVVHPLQLFAQPSMLEQIARERKERLQGVRVACYYGCMLTRPPDLARFDDAENPHAMDDVLQAAGIETLGWSGKTDCCGASLAFTDKGIMLRLVQRIFDRAQAAGADAIAVACPLCQVNLDTRQQEIEQSTGRSYGLPVLYFTQFLGLAFGLPSGQLMLERLFVAPKFALTGRLHDAR